jgi:hypothetical protein
MLFEGHERWMRGILRTALSQILTRVEGMEATVAPLHAARNSNCSASDRFELQAYFACPLRIM